MNSTIFISYRREDARADAGRLYDRLEARYPGRVFRDVGSIEPGADWRKTIQEVLRSAAACVVVIGPQWLTIADANGRRRLDDPNDVLRAEVASALASRTHIFPVLVGEANTPRRSQLPNDLQRLASCNAIELSEQDFDAGFDKLVRALDRVVERPPWRTAPLKSWLAAAAAIAMAVSLAVAFAVKRDASPPREGSSQQPATPSPSDTDAKPPSSDSTGALSVGRLTLRWDGANSTSWQVRDPKTQAVLKDLAVGAASSETAEFGAGRYVITIPDKPEIGPLPATVAAGKVAVVAPAIAQITLQWSGADSTNWEVLDEKTRTAVRHLAVGAASSATADIGPGRYLVRIAGKPEIAALPVTTTADRASIVAPQIGQITFHWPGANAILWQLLDEKNRATLRQLVNGAGSSQTVDAGIGRYLLSITGMPELAPIAVTVSAGRMSTVAPQVGRVTVEWRGSKAIAIQVIDAERRNAVRQLYLIPSSSQTLDMAPGRYLIAPQSAPDMKAIEVTVTAGDEVRAAFG
jgi:hypothetical protein